MYITQEADYAMRIVYCLAKTSGRRDARSIGQEACVTLRFSLKILGKLASAGIVNSYKGNKGGYELARPPKDISLKDVLHAVEGPYTMARCISGGVCSSGIHQKCGVQRILGGISQDVNQKLAQVSFEDLVLEEQVC